MSEAVLRVAGAVLCGGRSTRMGRPKAWLEVAGETFLSRVLRVLAEVVSPRLVVAAPGQDLPLLPADVEVWRDPQQGRGPLQGLAVALQALVGRVEAVYLSSCDVPALQPALVQQLIERLGQAAICVPRVDGRLQPLAALYRTDLVGIVQRRLDEQRLRLLDLFEEVPTQIVEDVQGGECLRNVNTPDEYAAVLQWLESQQPGP